MGKRNILNMTRNHKKHNYNIEKLNDNLKDGTACKVAREIFASVMVGVFSLFFIYCVMMRTPNEILHSVIIFSVLMLFIFNIDKFNNSEFNFLGMNAKFNNKIEKIEKDVKEVEKNYSVMGEGLTSLNDAVFKTLENTQNLIPQITPQVNYPVDKSITNKALLNKRKAVVFSDLNNSTGILSAIEGYTGPNKDFKFDTSPLQNWQKNFKYKMKNI